MIEYENLQKLNKPFFVEYQKAFASVLESGWFILGKNVEEFEKEFAAYLKVNHCLGVASGLDALLLSLKALDLPVGSEVIVPSNTYIATILAICQAGLIPVLAEPDLATYNISATEIRNKITAKTKALMIVHLYGKACEMDSILDICQTHKLKLIEDCAQSHGATYKGKMTGTFGDFGAFSFYPTKNLGALGDGGCVTTNNSEYADKIRKLRNYGSSKKYYNDILGYNSRLDEVQAAFLRIKLKKLSDINSHKRQLADVYLKTLKDHVVKPQVQADYFDVYHIFNIRHPRRNDLRSFLETAGIKTEIHYPLAPHHQIAFKNFSLGEFPLSEEIHRTTLSLPISYFHTQTQIQQVAESINRFK